MNSKIRTLIINDARKGTTVDTLCNRYGFDAKQIAKVIPVTNGINRKPSEAPKMIKKPLKKVPNPIMVEAGKKAWETRRKMYGGNGMPKQNGSNNN